MAEWPSHFISGETFQKRPNGNHGFDTPLAGEPGPKK